MPRPIELHVEGLFGELTHDIKIRDNSERITILTGPNGSGKTHVLNILRGMIGQNLMSVARLPLTSATLTYDSGDHLRLVVDDGTAEISARINGRNRKAHRFPIAPDLDSDEFNIPAWLERRSPNRWFDRRTGRSMSDEMVARRYGVKISDLKEVEWLRELAPPAPPILIATERLDVREDLQRERAAAIRTGRDSPEAVARILQYVERISNLISEAKRESLASSQRADRQFAARALGTARETINPVRLRERYERVSGLHQELHANGLTEETIGVDFPSKTNPTERRILNVFLSDWEDKLRPLQPAHEKLQLLREVVGSKMLTKRISFNTRGQLSFRTRGGEAVSVEMLSSGEQHLLALYTMLLFDAAPGSVVLIDEPEISLHAAWKHAFLTDIYSVAELNDLSIVVATHSTSIINGRWDLVEELKIGSLDVE